jgi:molecular chaperone Hsp33
MDELHTFLFEGRPVRGLFVRLSRGWPALLSRREPGDEHPPAVRRLLGEMTAAAVLMHANLRYAGGLVLQIFGDGPVKLAVVEVQPGLSYRATAKVIGEVESDATLVSMVDRHGRGRCAITLDPADKSGGRQPYQGVVDLRAGRLDAHGAAVAPGPVPSVATVIEHYMRQSEQLSTHFVLAADDEGAAGLLVQRLPVEGEANLAGVASAFAGAASALASDDADRAFEHAAVLAATLSEAELLRTDVPTVLRRLYHEDDLRMFELRRPAFMCRCSRERVRSMLQSLGQGEVVSVLHERGEVEIGCDFCGLRYRFDAVDVGEMFAPRADQAPGSSAIN